MSFIMPDKNLVLSKEQLALWDKAEKEAKATGKSLLAVTLELLEKEAK